MQKKVAVVIVYCLIYLITSVFNAADPQFKVHWLNNSSKTPSTIYLYAHGFMATYKQAIDMFTCYKYKNCQNPYWIIHEPVVLFNFPDAKNDTDFYRHQVNLGQQLDLERFDYAFKEMQGLFDDKHYVLVGLSRGAATIINYVAMHKPPQVKALVLESPFDNFENIINHILKKRLHLHWIPLSTQLGLLASQYYFPSLNQNGIFPIRAIVSIPVDIPIIFIHSKKDRVISINASRRLYKILRSRGHQHVYLLELNQGRHGFLLEGDDASRYQKVIHAFYQKYNLPHNQQLAQQGKKELENIQPSVDEVAQRIKKHKR